MLSPYAWLAVGALVLSMFAGTYWKGFTHGRDNVRAEWDADKDKRKIAENKAVADRIAENAAIKTQAELNKRKAKEKNEKDNSKLRADSDAARASGLHVDAAICGELAGKTNSASSSVVDDTAPIKLPAATERRLFDIADDAEKCSAQLLNLQTWIVDSGLYKE